MLHKDKLIVFRKIARILSVFVVRRRAAVFWKARKNVFRAFLTRAKNIQIWQSSTAKYSPLSFTERQNFGTYEYILLLTSDVHRFERIFEPVKRCMNTSKMFSKLTHIENTTRVTIHEKIKVWSSLYNEKYVTFQGDCKFIVNQIDKTVSNHEL